MRDSRADEAYFDGAVSVWERTALRHERETQLPPEKHRYPAFVAAAANGAMRERAGEFSARYSRGDDLATLRVTFDAWLDAAELAEREKQHPDAAEMRAVQDDPAGENLAHYVPRLWLVGVALALRVDDEQFERVANAVKPLWSDRVVSALLATRRAGIPVSDVDWFPARFGALADVFVADPESRPAALADYLSSWYPRVKGMSWWDGHKYLAKRHYMGYWAFEVAGVVAALGIDDTSFQDAEFYPADVIDRR